MNQCHRSAFFWYDPADKSFFGVRKQEITPKQVEEAADKGLPFINYPHLHRQVWAKWSKGDYTQFPKDA